MASKDSLKLAKLKSSNSVACAAPATRNVTFSLDKPEVVRSRRATRPLAKSTSLSCRNSLGSNAWPSSRVDVSEPSSRRHAVTNISSHQAPNNDVGKRGGGRRRQSTDSICHQSACQSTSVSNKFPLNKPLTKFQSFDWPSSYSASSSPSCSVPSCANQNASVPLLTFSTHNKNVVSRPQTNNIWISVHDQ